MTRFDSLMQKEKLQPCLVFARSRQKWLGETLADPLLAVGSDIEEEKRIQAVCEGRFRYRVRSEPTT